MTMNTFPFGVRHKTTPKLTPYLPPSQPAGNTAFENERFMSEMLTQS